MSSKLKSKKPGSSSTNWEDSYFGGHRKLLSDYPEIHVPFDIDVSIIDDSLNWYQKTKLGDLFLLKIKDFKLTDMLLVGAKMEERGSQFSLSKRKYLVAVPDSIKSCLNQIMIHDRELSDLFRYFYKTIESADISFRLPDPKKDNPEEGEEGEGEGEGEKEGDGKKEKTGDSGEMTIKKAMLIAGRLFNEIKKRRNIFGQSQDAISPGLKEATKFVTITPNSVETKYTRDETIYAGRLVDLLDISFEPTRDIINNLKLGKLDTGKLASAPAGNHHIYYKVEENQSTKPFSVCILMDESGSMGGCIGATSKGYHQQRIVKILYKAFSEIMPTDRIYIYGHSSNSESPFGEYPEIRVYNDKYNDTFERTIVKQESNGWCNNYDGPVIECVYEKVRGYTQDNIIFISVSDGQPSGHGYGGEPAIKDMKRIIEKCKRDGFVTIGIGVQYSGVSEIYNYHSVINTMKDIPKKVSMIVNHVVKTEFQ